MNVVVIAGGLSPERDVSLSSGSMIANALIENGHNVLLMDIYLGMPGVSNFSDAYKKNKKENYEYIVPEREPDLDAVRAARGGSLQAGDSRGGNEQLIGDGVIAVCAGADITFNALHGAIGENGQIQAVFDIYGIKYTGTGYEGSFLAMDKPLSKELMRHHGIRTPDWVVLNADGAVCGGCGDIDAAARVGKSPAPAGIGAAAFGSNRAASADIEAAIRDGCRHILDRIGLPCVIKPCSCGSSVGVSIVKSCGEMEAALKYAFAYEKHIIAEVMVAGREFSVGVLGGDALPPIEIIPRKGFFDYKNKYQSGATLEVCPPADLPPGSEEAMQGMALKVHEILRLGDYSRMDLILDEAGDIFFLETNTLPGMTPTSLLPKEAAAAGIAYPLLCERIVNLAKGVQ